MDKILIYEALFIAALIIGINIFIYWLYPWIDGKRKNKSRDIIPLCSDNMHLAVIKKSDHAYEFMILNRNEAKYCENFHCENEEVL